MREKRFIQNLALAPGREAIEASFDGFGLNKSIIPAESLIHKKIKFSH